MEDLKGRYIRWSDACVWQSFGTSLAILRVSLPDSPPLQEAEQGIKLNTTAKDIWNLCDGTRTFEDIITQLLEEYQGEPERIQENVERIISMLKKQGFLTCEDAPRFYALCEISPQKWGGAPALPTLYVKTFLNPIPSVHILLKEDEPISR